MGDDLLAGAYACLVLHLLHRALAAGWGAG